MFTGAKSSNHYVPRAAPLFRPARIVLAKGSHRTEARRRFAGRICEAYPEVEVVEAFDTPHNRVDLGTADPLRLHERGKQTLVLGEHRSAVRFSAEEGNSCPNYWHFSPYGFCPYGCHYCYLAGTPGVWFSPTVKIFLNLDEILVEIDRTANRIDRPTAFYLGKLQDGLALEPLTGYPQAQRLMELNLGRENAISTLLRGLSQFSSDENGTVPFQPAMLNRLLNSFASAKPLAIHAENSRVRALPTESRLEIMDRLKAIARHHGLRVLVCGCKNPDITSGSCHISGRRPSTAGESSQLGLFQS